MNWVLITLLGVLSSLTIVMIGFMIIMRKRRKILEESMKPRPMVVSLTLSSTDEIEEDEQHIGNQ